MEYSELVTAFCQPIVKDEVLCDPSLNAQYYHELIEARNVEDLCAWCKCPHKIQLEDLSECPVFCSTDCQFYSQQFLSSLSKPTKKISPIGPIVEKFSEQRPPKPLKAFRSEDIEGHRIRIGPYRENLNEIQQWFGGFPIAVLKGLSPEQEEVFNLVNSILKPLRITLKKNTENLFFFGNMNIRNVKALTEADDQFKKAFSFALLDLLTKTDVTTLLTENKIYTPLYDDIFNIVSQGSEDVVI